MRMWPLLAAGVGLLAMTGIAVKAQSGSSNEQPAYESIVTEGAYEVREYAPMLVAQVSHDGARGRALGAGFRRLAAYIFGQDRPDNDAGETIAMTSPVIQDPPEKIAMTSPVIQDPSDVDKWRTRFVMPSKYTMETLPTPPADIVIEEVPSRRMAAVQFPGNPDTRALSAMEGKLREWMTDQGLKAVGPAEYAFYDAPMVPARFRRNEVMIPVAAE